MVCDKCEVKLSKLVVPDKWTDGARNTTGGKDGGRAVGGKSRLSERRETSRTSRGSTLTPISRACKICKSTVTQKMHYCNQCAYKKGICAMCGRKVLDTKEFKMSS